MIKVFLILVDDRNNDFGTPQISKTVETFIN
jgi:hypothetical protein